MIHSKDFKTRTFHHHVGSGQSWFCHYLVVIGGAWLKVLSQISKTLSNFGFFENIMQMICSISSEVWFTYKTTSLYKSTTGVSHTFCGHMVKKPLWYCKGCDSIRLRSLSASSCVYLFELFIYLLPRVLQSLLLNYISL